MQRHAQRREDLARRELIQRLPSFSRQQFAQNDESDVAVESAFPRRRGEGRSERGINQVRASGGEFEQLFVRRQSAGVFQQHANGYGRTFGLLMPGRQRDEFGHGLRHGLVQRQLAAFVKPHRDRGRRNHFG